VTEFVFTLSLFSSLFLWAKKKRESQQQQKKKKKMMIGKSATLPSSSLQWRRGGGGGGEDKKSERRRPVFTRRGGNASTSRRRRTSVSSSISSSSSSSSSSQEEKLYTPPQPLPDGPLITLERRANKFIVDSAVFVIDKLYEGRDYPRFYALETIARVPYFSFLSVLHLYESFGWWRRADYLKVHFAETMNEYHHLLIMEAMGGADSFKDRFFAQHVAVVYFWVAVLIYMVSPRMAYNLSEQVEEHAYATYDDFLKRKGEELKQTPACGVAVSYFQLGDLYLFDEFQTNVYEGLNKATNEEIRRPKIKNMYDVIENVRNDELEHVKTMSFCQKPGNLLRANSSVRAQKKAQEICDGISENDTAQECDLIIASGQDLEGERSCEGVLDCVVKGFEERTIGSNNSSSSNNNNIGSSSSGTNNANNKVVSNSVVEKREDKKKA
jgi:ubiquinol oxidase